MNRRLLRTVLASGLLLLADGGARDSRPTCRKIDQVDAELGGRADHAVKAGLRKSSRSCASRAAQGAETGAAPDRRGEDPGHWNGSAHIVN
jgi:hypothetical protein